MAFIPRIRGTKVGSKKGVGKSVYFTPWTADFFDGGDDDDLGASVARGGAIPDHVIAQDKVPVDL